MLLIAACAIPPPCTVAPPIMTLSAAELDFGALTQFERVERTVILANEGGMPLGIGEIEPTTGDFEASWDACAIECPEEASAKGDTGWEDTAWEDTWVRPCGDEDGALFVLPPGCQLPLTIEYQADGTGASEDALRVYSVDATEDAAGEPAFRADPLHAVAHTWLTGSSDGAPFVAVTPPSLAFDEVYPADVAFAEALVRNVGVAPATLTELALSGTCAAAYTLSTLPSPGLVLEPGDEVSIEVQFAPTTTDAARCVLTVYSDDVRAPLIDVILSGNDGSANTAPTVSIASPEPGSAASTSAGLVLEIELADAEQPASSLTCGVYGTTCWTYVDCAAPDDSGTVVVEISGSDLCTGADILRVQVTDTRGEIADAAVPIRIDSVQSASDADGDAVDVPGDCDDTDAERWPGAREREDGADDNCDGVIDDGTSVTDDDGDGWSEGEGDCDDQDDDSYPSAAERADGADNDCDGAVDEETLLFDDDGDGWTELEQDCDDADAAIHPGASDGCDGLDNNCDLTRDDLPECSDLQIVADFLVFDATAVNEGATVTVLAHISHADAASLVLTWSSDEDVAFDASFEDGVAVATFTAPRFADGDLSIALHAEDTSGTDAAWATIYVAEAGVALGAAECASD